MSKKGSDTPTSARIRENQRRSRNRRKELIEDLQQRVRDYELKGIEATQDMQRAARRVAQENAGLRSMLAQRGVTQTEVETFLQSFNDGGTAKNVQNIISSKLALPQCATPESTSSPGVGAIESLKDTRHDHQDISRTHYYSRHTQDQLDIAAMEVQEMDIEGPRRPTCGPPPAKCCSGERDHNDSHDKPEDHSYQPELSTREAPECPNTSDCFCPPTSTIKISPPNSGLEISCETAASIIIEMRGDGDIEAVRASLGCKGREDCTVRNSTVLQIMDER